MDTAYSLQIYEICGEKATFSFFLKKEEKTRAGKRGTGSAGKRMREEENGRGEKDRKSVPPGKRKREPEPRGKAGYRDGTPGTERRKRYRMKPRESGRTDYGDSAPAGHQKSRPRQGRDKSANPRGAEIPHTERRAVSQTAAGHGPRMEDAPHGGEGCQLQNVDSASCITATFCI